MIQIDISMPKACDVCPFNYDFVMCNAMNDQEWEKHGDEWNEQVCEGEHRPDFCSLTEIVKCKDCRFAKRHNANTIKCLKKNNDTGWANLFHHLDWFCADGERGEL